MRGGLRVGNLFGIPFYINYTWFAIAGLLTLSYAFNLLNFNSSWNLPTALAVGLATSLGLFGSVLAHELAHSLAARAQGISVTSITLFIFGGMATIERESDNPWAAFRVAIAGPLLSFALFLALKLVQLSRLVPETSGLGVWVSNIAGANLIIALFNLIPGLPLDGGQILKAVVWGVTGDRHTGMKWAARSGQIVGWGTIGLGLLLGFAESSFAGLWIGFIGLFILNSARRYSQYLQLQQVLTQLMARDAMRRNFRVVDVALTLREFADRYLIPAEEREVFFADCDGRYKGMVDPEAMRQIERSQWELENLYAILTPMDQLEGIAEEASIPEVIRLMRNGDRARVPVLSPTGAIAGLIDKGDIVRSLGERLGIAISPELVQRVREENKFPAGFPVDIDSPA
ncbi:site-2 protease family protein [Synechococcus sp. PCC 7336]|uniref:site-2 protease family protein n=1 Tax=Synechococcus sp. PCC 7336 TaxID=195250 RepID=UPI00034BF632|nr:site-2 protease family protein [Synechococcus sp. PCC 7336]